MCGFQKAPITTAYPTVGGGGDPGTRLYLFRMGGDFGVLAIADGLIELLPLQ